MFRVLGLTGVAVTHSCAAFAFIIFFSDVVVSNANHYRQIDGFSVDEEANEEMVVFDVDIGPSAINRVDVMEN
jgi:hypothetical protein